MRLSRNTAAFLCFLFLAAFALDACTNKQKEGTGHEIMPQKRGTFVIALLPEENVFLQKRRYRPLTEYLSKRLGMDVKTRLLDSYSAVYAQMLDRNADAAFFGALSYIAMDSRLPLDTIARPFRENGGSRHRGVIFVLKGRGITEDIATWRGKRVALVDRSTAAGYIYPVWYLRTRGIGNLNGFFRKVVYAGSNDAAIEEVVNGNADIGCASSDIFSDFIRRTPSARNKLIVLARSSPLPSDVIGVREDMAPLLAGKLRDALIEMDKTEEGRTALAKLGAERFIATSEAGYTPLLEMLKTLHIKPGDIALASIKRDDRAAASLNPKGPKK